MFALSLRVCSTQSTCRKYRHRFAYEAQQATRLRIGPTLRVNARARSSALCRTLLPASQYNSTIPTVAGFLDL
jgi:hypothetical protein